MTTHANATIDWHAWLERFEAKQNGFMPAREERFALMLDILDVLLPEAFIALDLACGPGSVSRRLLARFPHARCVAVDLDPLLLAIGQQVLGTLNGRLRWVEADLTQADWLAALGEPGFDAVLTTTALHWLPPDHLVRLYRQLYELIRPDGVLLNGDHFPFAPHLETFRRVDAELSARRRQPAMQREGRTTWQSFWEAAHEAPELAELLAERDRRFAWQRPDRRMPIRDLHAAALHDAGFREVGTMWQTGSMGLLMAVR